MVRMQHIIMHGPGLSVRGGGWGFPPVTNNVAPGYFHRKIKEIKIEPKEIPSCLIPRPLVVFIQQLEILVTALMVHARVNTFKCLLPYTHSVILQYFGFVLS